ncbi:MAG: PhzF family phenazine biosynthesis protein, partial [Acidobacteria bacterium]|nr:PhzF family phenazine biosynthesis protein [Acidobacteriota bacterium]
MSAHEIPIYQVDAFTSERFRGNPAAVCPLTSWLPDELLQNIAAENNLSETAYFVPNGEGFELRWFTPACEVELCGHATLASAYVLFEELGFAGDVLRFRTRYRGEVSVTRRGKLLTLDFPANPALPVARNPELDAALGA